MKITYDGFKELNRIIRKNVNKKCLTINTDKEMNYKDNRIKMAMANVEQKANVLKEARDAHLGAIKKAAEVIESVFIEKVAKPGEIIRTKRGNEIFYFDHIEAGAFGFIEVVCHPQKKDGTPSLAIRKMSVSEFADI